MALLVYGSFYGYDLWLMIEIGGKLIHRNHQWQYCCSEWLVVGEPVVHDS